MPALARTMSGHLRQSPPIPARRCLWPALGTEVVGTFQLTIQPTLLARGGARALVEAVQVAPTARGRGIGAAMMRFAMDEARARGAVQLALASSKRRTDAHRFYERLGFVRSHEGFKLKLR